jgi:hypothetical protein
MNAPLFAARLVLDDLVRSFQVRPALPAGWEAAEYENQRMVYQQHYADWHRVELALVRFRREIAELRSRGWLDT